jgi:prevent-host-death family protein
MKFMEPNSFSFRSAQMPKTVSTREAQDSLSTLIGWAKEHRDQVIVESHGEPAAVLMSFAEYETLRLEQAPTAPRSSQRTQCRP